MLQIFFSVNVQHKDNKNAACSAPAASVTTQKSAA